MAKRIKNTHAKIDSKAAEMEMWLFEFEMEEYMSYGDLPENDYSKSYAESKEKVQVKMKDIKIPNSYKYQAELIVYKYKSD